MEQRQGAGGRCEAGGVSRSQIEKQQRPGGSGNTETAGKVKRLWSESRRWGSRFEGKAALGDGKESGVAVVGGRGRVSMPQDNSAGGLEDVRKTSQGLVSISLRMDGTRQGGVSVAWDVGEQAATTGGRCKETGQDRQVPATLPFPSPVPFCMVPWPVLILPWELVPGGPAHGHSWGGRV